MPLTVASPSLSHVLPHPPCSSILKEEGARALFMSPRYGGQDRLGEAAAAFEPELGPAAFHGGYQPIASKRLRALKHIVVATKEQQENGTVRFLDLPVYGNGASRRGGDGLPAVGPPSLAALLRSSMR
jgi:hypothetical protein